MNKKFVIFFHMPVYMVIIYHYYIEGVVWRMRESPELREIFTS